MQIVKKFWIWLIGLPILFVFSTYWYFDLSDTFGNILTFLSVVTGFTITGLSIIATSSFSKNLYRQEDPQNNAKTLLHVLIDKFTSSMILSAFIIFLILVYPFTLTWGSNPYEFCNTEISILQIVGSLIWLLTLLVLVYYIILVKFFAKFVIQAAKSQ